MIAVAMHPAAMLARYTEQAPVTSLGPRLLLTLAVLGLTALALWGMRRNWRKRADRQSWVVPPVGPPDGFAPRTSYPARYVASVETGDWLQRIAAAGLGMPGEATVAVGAGGLLVARVGEPDLYLPAEAILGVDSARGIAQEVYEREGLVVITWRSGGGSVTTGLRMGSAADHVALLADVAELIGGAPAADGTADGEGMVQ